MGGTLGITRVRHPVRHPLQEQARKLQNVLTTTLSKGTWSETEKSLIESLLINSEEYLKERSTENKISVLQFCHSPALNQLLEENGFRPRSENSGWNEFDYIVPLN